MSLFGTSGGGFTFGTPSSTAFGFGTSQAGNTAGKVFGATSTPSFGGFGAATTASSGSVFGTSFGVKTTASSTFGKFACCQIKPNFLFCLKNTCMGDLNRPYNGFGRNCGRFAILMRPVGKH